MYNIIIPVIYRDYSFLSTTIRYIRKNLSPQKIFILTDTRFMRFLPKTLLNHENCTIIDENALIDGLTKEAIETMFCNMGRNPMRAGWYYQQFLKMAFALSDYCDTEYYLSWDSDTLPLRKIDFFNPDGRPLFTMKTERHMPYFVAIERLLNIKKFNDRSFIAENMLFNKAVMQDLINQIQSNCQIDGHMWYEKIICALVPESVSFMGFSEFETYGNFCQNIYPKLYKERTLPSFRCGALIQGRFVSDKILEQLSFDQATVSFEIYDRPPFPWGGLTYLYARWQRRKELFIRKWLLK